MCYQSINIHISDFLAYEVTGETPGHGSSAWAETPGIDRSSGEPVGETPSAKRRSRWDETPVNQMGGATPVFNSGVTPSGTAAMAMPTPSPGIKVMFM